MPHREAQKGAAISPRLLWVEALPKDTSSSAHVRRNKAQLTALSLENTPTEPASQELRKMDPRCSSRAVHDLTAGAARAQRAIERYVLPRRVVFPHAGALLISHGPRGAGGRLNRIAAWTIVTVAAQELADRIEREGRPREARLLRETTPHTFRHFVAMWLLNEGAQLSEVSALLGHANTRITEQYYARHTDDRLQELHDQFAPDPEER